jgi:hypothetical protein
MYLAKDTSFERKAALRFLPETLQKDDEITPGTLISIAPSQLRR